MPTYKNSKIKSLKAKEILDSKGNPTVEVELKNALGVFRASVPSGVSTGKHEAVELRDKDGRGISGAIENIEKIIGPALKNEDLTDQNKIDNLLIGLDGTENKSRLGANAILPVSIAVCRVGAEIQNIPLYKKISEVAGINLEGKLPKPSFNMIEGGEHAKNGLAFQEFMIIPQKQSFKENLEIGLKVYQKLKENLESKYGNVELSREGAFAVPIEKILEAFDLILEAAAVSSHKDDIKFAIDAAASSFFEGGGYKINNEILSKEKLVDFYRDIITKYPIASLEDPFEEEDFQGFSEAMGETIIFGDDLLVSNVERIKIAQKNGTYNGLILKPNQVGTVTETIDAAKLAKSFGWKIMVANRAGETEDDFIADLAFGIGAEFIKSGAPFPKERMAKYNRLLRIEKEIL